MKFVKTIIEQCIEECKKHVEENKIHEEMLAIVTHEIINKIYPYILLLSILILFMLLLLIGNLIFLFIMLKK